MIAMAIMFRGVAVGIQVMSETEDERELIACLEGMAAEGDRRSLGTKPHCLFLCPKLPGAAANRLDAAELAASLKA